MELSGLDLRRYLVACIIDRHGEATVAELAEDLLADGFTTPARASKAIPDALRAERTRGRVVRLDRGRYGLGTLPRTTRHRIVHHARRLADDRRQIRTPTPLSLASGTPTDDPLAPFHY